LVLLYATILLVAQPGQSSLPGPSDT
jgi:hypothetical protein